MFSARVRGMVRSTRTIHNACDRAVGTSAARQVTNTLKALFSHNEAYVQALEKENTKAWLVSRELWDWKSSEKRLVAEEPLLVR